MPLYALGEHVPQVPAEDRYWIAPDAHVIGKVVLGEDVGIWFGAVLRGDNEPITDRRAAPISRKARCCTSIRATLLPSAKAAPSATTPSSMAAPSATIRWSAWARPFSTARRSARNCLVGANALVTEGKEFPDNSLIVGSPAKAIRTLDDQAVAGLTRSAESYVRNWKSFAKDLRKL